MPAYTWTDNLRRSREYVQTARALAEPFPDLSKGHPAPEALLLSYALALRICNLADVSTDLLKRDELVSASLVARGALESVFILVVLRLKADEVDSLDALGSFCTSAHDMMYASRMQDWLGDHLPIATNLLTYLKSAEEELGDTRLVFDMLCDISHPNVFGVLAQYVRVIDGKPTIGEPLPSARETVRDTVGSALRVSTARAVAELSQLQAIFESFRHLS